MLNCHLQDKFVPAESTDANRSHHVKTHLERHIRLGGILTHLGG